MAHEYAKEAKASHERKLKSYGKDEKALGSKEKAKNWAGFDALNTDEQAGMRPLNKSASMSDETNPRIMRKKGGKVVGANSLKRLDKAPRKGKASGGQMQGTGQRIGAIPSPQTQQEDFDPQLRGAPGKMAPGTMRNKGGKIQDYEARSDESQGVSKRPVKHSSVKRTAKANGGGFEELLGSIGNALFGEETEAPESRAPARASRGMDRHAARHPVVRHRVTETEHPVDVPLPPRRPAQFTGPEGAVMSAGGPQFADPGAIENMHRRSVDPRGTSSTGLETTAETFGNSPTAEANANEFYRNQGIGVRPAPAPSADSSTANPFFAEHLYRKNGGRLGRASGGKSEHPDEAEDKALIRKMVKKEDLKMKDGGRAHRAKGGKTTVNIMLGQPQQQGINPMALAALAEMAGGPQGGPPQQLPPPGAMPPPGAGAPPPQMMAPPPSAPPGPPPGGPPMMRKDGGKVQVPYKKPSRKGEYPAMDFGSGGGFGRKQKIDAYGDKQKS